MNKEMKDIKVYGDNDGTKVVSYETYAEMAQEMLTNNKPFDTGNRKVNPNGTIASSRTLFEAVNLENEFINRYKLLEDGKTLIIVTDYRAIKEIDTNNVYKKNIPGYKITRDNKKLVVKEMVMVKDDDLVANYNDKLGYSAMVEVRKAIKEYEDNKITGNEKIPF